MSLTTNIGKQGQSVQMERRLSGVMEMRVASMMQDRRHSMQPEHMGQRRSSGGVIEDEATLRKRATERLYLLIPNHKCPNRDCPFHPPVETREEEELAEGTLIRPPTKVEETDDDAGMPRDEYLSEITVDTGEESVASDYESVMTLDSGFGRERDELSDTEGPVVLASPDVHREPELEHIDEDDEVLTLTSEQPALEDVTEIDADDERVTPVPFIQLKEGQEITEDARHRVTYKDGVATLQVTDLEPQDGGQYTCRAINALGDIETTAELQVEEVRHRRKRKEEAEAVPKVKVPKQEVEGDMPPEFTLPLVDQIKQAGEDVELCVTVTCRPEPEVKWFCGDQLITPSSRHVFEHDKGVYRLTIRKLTKEDAGEWRCQAINQFGKAWCSCDLKVLESTPEGYRAPRFPRELEDMTVTRGSVVQLECEVIGYPQPSIQWFKDRKRIQSDRHYTIRTENNLCVLQISGVDYDDTGAYMCRALNEAGSTDTEARVRVQSVRDTVMRPDRPDAVGRVEGAPAARYKYQVAPDFTVKLKNKRVPEGMTVHLNCSVTGIPEPSVRWMKDGVEIFEGTDYSMRNNYGLLSLEIVNSRARHAGTYTCEASNDEGTVSCSATLDVEGEEELEAVELEFLRPRILTPLEDIMVNEGEDVTFTVKAVGKPMPNFKWQKDMLELSSTNRMHLTSDSKGNATLTIRKVRPSDAGLYLVLAHTRSGRAKSSANLRVRAKSKSSSPEIVEYGRPAYEGGYASLQQMAIPGKPPSFSIMLPASLSVHEGEKLRLDCSVQGYPTPIVSWHKEYRGLMYGERHRIMFVGSLHTLEIPSTMARDKGEYIVRATNAFGCVETSCHVTILPRRERGAEDLVAGDMMQIDAAQRIKTDKEAPRRGKAPFFIKHLPRTIEVMEGTNVRLDCILRGGVELVQWSQDDIDRAKRELEGEGFEGDFVPMRDGADSARSTSGKSADVEGAPPSFKTTPQDLVLPAGSEAVFECVTSGSSTKSGTWSKNGKPLAPSDTVRITSDGHRHRLVIAAIVKSDEGEYTYEATSAAGSAACSATLTIQVMTEKGRLSRTQSMERQRRSSPDPDKAKPSKSAKFSRELPEQTSASPGDNVTLSCSISGDIKEVHWEKDGKKLSDSSRISSSQQRDGTVSLKLSGLKESDLGSYRCVAVMADGTEAETSTRLSLAAKPEPMDDDSNDVAPKFTKKLRDHKIGDGDTIVLDCSVEGQPRPQITWSRNGVEILDNQDILISTIGSNCKLQILDVYPEDEGHYSCTATNSAGEATTTCYVTVEGGTRGKRETSGNANLGLKEVEFKLDIGKRRLPSPDVKKPEKVRAPEFVVKPRRQFIDEGQSAKFKVSYDGSPATLTWNKDGKPLSDGKKYKIYEKDSYHFLEVLDVESEDSGMYVGTVTNSAGTDTASAELDVFAKPKLLSRAAKPPPTLVNPLQDLRVAIGDQDVRLDCRVSDADDCQATWYHDGKELRQGRQHKSRFTGVGASLTITEIGEEDGGIYECVVSNSSGEVRTSCTLSTDGERLEPPVFVKELQDLEVEDGDKVELIVEVKDSDTAGSEESI